MVGVFHSFTWLRNNQENTVRNLRDNNALQHQASVKNRRLAQQMERRPAVMAALKLKKVSVYNAKLEHCACLYLKVLI